MSESSETGLFMVFFISPDTKGKGNSLSFVYSRPGLVHFPITKPQTICTGLCLTSYKVTKLRCMVVEVVSLFLLSILLPSTHSPLSFAPSPSPSFFSFFFFHFLLLPYKANPHHTVCINTPFYFLLHQEIPAKPPKQDGET